MFKIYWEKISATYQLPEGGVVKILNNLSLVIVPKLFPVKWFIF